ncbi:MAG: hypothetical protein ACAH95_06155 [Fimbriimonas sp.]
MRPLILQVRAFQCLAAAILISLAGCGGGGSAGNSPNIETPPESESVKSGTARFTVDVETGRVSVTPLNGSARSRAIFTGTAAEFQSSNLLVDTGELTRRKLAVTLKNNAGEPIGTPGSGFKVMFGEFKNGISNDLRTQTMVSTFAGTSASGSADGPVASATFSSPHSVLRDDNGDVYVSGYNQSVRLIKDGQVTTVATGTGPLTSMIWNSNGNRDYIYAASLNTHKIVRIDVNTRAVTVLAGTGSSGSNDGPGSTARFNLPYALIDLGTGGANPDLLVSEGTTGKMRLMVHNGTEYIVSTLGWTSDAPRGMYSLGNGLFMVANAFIRKFAICNINGVISYLGSGASGQDNGNGNTMTFFEPIGIYAPASLADGNRTVYLSESSGLIRQLTLRENGNPVSPLDWTSAHLAGRSQDYGFADGPGDLARFLGPVCMSSDLSGNILVADSGNNRIRKITPLSGNFPIDLGGANTGVDKVRLANPSDFVPTDAGPTPFIQENQTIATNAQVDLTPWSLIIPEGVRSFEFVVTIEAETTSSAPPDAVFNAGPGVGPGSSRAMVRTLAGVTKQGYANGSVSSATFGESSAFAYDAAGILYVADSINHAVRRIDRSGMVTTIAGVPGNSGSADGLGSQASFSSVSGIAVDPSGREVYVTDSSNNTVRRIAALTPSGLDQPYNWQVSTIAGTAGPAAYAEGSGDVAGFSSPWGIVITNGGELLVSESTGNRIRRLQPTGADRSLSTNWVVSLVAGNPLSVSPPGQTVNGTGAAARFNLIRGIALAKSGELYVTEVSRGEVRRVSPAGTVTAFAGGSANGFADSDTGSAALFNAPQALAVDSAGYVYVADTANHVVRRISPSGAVRTVAGTGVIGTVDGPGNVAKFRTMHAIAVTNAGDVIVGDWSRVRLIERLISSGVSQ